MLVPCLGAVGGVCLVARFWPPPASMPPGHCRKCGYDLTGNTSGVCTECDTLVPGHEANRTAAVPPDGATG